MNYPEYAAELIRLLEEDQVEWKAFNLDKYNHPNDPYIGHKHEIVKAAMGTRATRALEVLREIQEPSISNIGIEGAQAMSVMASHHSKQSTEHVLAAFEHCYEVDPNDTFKQTIPPMRDWLDLLNNRPQTYGTIWHMDNGWPFLPTVVDFPHVNERRKVYDLEPLRWPKSLAIPESEQPWLTQPLSTLVMRDLTKDERATMLDEAN